MTSRRNATGRAVARMIIAVAAALASTCAASAAAACAAAASAASAKPAAAAPACGTAGLEVWLGLGPGAAAAGSTYYPLEFTNVTERTCHLRGFPGVSAVSVSGGQVGSPAARDRSSAPRTVTLAPGGTAHVPLQLVDAGNFEPGRMRPGRHRWAKDLPARAGQCRAGPVRQLPSVLCHGPGLSERGARPGRNRCSWTSMTPAGLGWLTSPQSSCLRRGPGETGGYGGGCLLGRDPERAPVHPE